MRKFTFIFVALTFVIASCGSTKKTSENKDEYSEFKNITESDSLFASIYRSPCFGTCANYKLSIYNSGYAVYEGKRNTEMIGTFTTQFTASEMKGLLELANRVGYGGLEADYDNKNVTDLPSTTTSIILNGKRVEVRCRINCPAELKKFQDEFDVLAATKEWKAEASK